ncbi:MAG TPA: flagellar biosynthesis protein FlhA [Phycisphaerales bacterium]|nr:flagellar biosynthesis protein FlhA [Phycisphaerales bacterium]
MPPLQSKSVPPWLAAIHRHRSLLVPIGFVSLLVILIVPLHPVVMDMLIAANISISVIILMTTMYLEEPLDFSVFPSLLLGTTLFRLVLNIATTRLILTADANSPEQAMGVAGKVIHAFGSFVAGGSLIVGVVLFIIIFIVQFVVITKGATRISEVAARFTLDAMPGKQMAIDADLNAGMINETQARERRERIAREADFFGAMDGASKFVRGDAIAGIIITFINVIGGFAIGALQKGWPPAQTAETFTILTIGDGLASQVPAFVISIAAALIVTRSGSKDNLGTEMTGQLTSRPIALVLTAAFIGALVLTPLPKIPMILLSLTFGALAWFTRKQEKEAVLAAQAAEAKPAPTVPPVEELLKIDTLELEVGYGLVSLVDTKQGGDLLDRISAVRRQLATELGLVMPPVRVRDNMTLSPNTYRFKIRGNVVAEGETRPGSLLAMNSGIATGTLNGIPTREPAFGLDAVWIEPGLKERAETMNYTVVDATSVLTTHLAEMVKTHADELLTREEVNNLLTQLKQRAPKLVEETIPGQLPVGELQKILQNLLRERVPIRDMETVLETISDWAAKTKDTDVLTEYVRNSLRRAICQLYAAPVEITREPSLGGREGSPAASGGGGAARSRLRIVCVTLDPALEDFISGYIDRSAAGTTMNIPARAAGLVARRVTDSLQPVIAQGHPPVVIASPQVRGPVRQIVEPFLPNVAVLGYNEIVPGIDVQSVALVTVPDEETAPLAA